ncbi:unnamed protein product, partial [Ectocarpus sp. 12 AP-2014]
VSEAWQRVALERAHGHCSTCRNNGMTQLVHGAWLTRMGVGVYICGATDNAPERFSTLVLLLQTTKTILLSLSKIPQSMDGYTTDAEWLSRSSRNLLPFGVWVRTSAQSHGGNL